MVQDHSAQPLPDISPITPETKDWTVVIDHGCPACGFDPSYDVTTTGDRVRATVDRWNAVLECDGITQRPREDVWSPLEYACHVRDVCQIFGIRLASMLGENNPVFDDWDQDAAAMADQYNRQHPADVSRALGRSAESTAAAFDAVSEAQWDRPGRRGDGKDFTVASFARYFLHDVEHHLVFDVRG